MSRFLYRLGRAMVRHRRAALGVWVLAVVATTVLNATVGGDFSDDFSLEDAESIEAYELLEERFPESTGATAQLVFRAREGTLADGPAAAAVQEVLAEVAELPEVVAVGDPTTFTDAAVAEGGEIGFANVTYGASVVELGAPAVEELQAVVEETADEEAVEVELGGELPNSVMEPETGGAEVAGVLAAVVILCVAFGSVIAMGLPIGLALFGLAGGISGLGVVALVLDIPTVAPLLATMIGLGVGIDYALFVVTRHRRHLAEGMTVEESAGRAIATAGQAVIFAGGTVVIAIGGLAIAGIPAVTMMGIATALVVVVMVLGSVTLVPALLGFAGQAIDRWRVPGVKPHSEAGETSLWARWGTRVSNRPVPFLLAGLVLLLTLAAPVLSMRLGQTDAGTLPTSTTQRRAYDLLAEGFGAGFNGPLLVTVELPAEGGEAVVTSLTEAVQAQDGVQIVSPPEVNEAGDTAVMPVIPESSPQDEATTDLVHRLRDDVIPGVTAGTGATAYVGGLTATFIDVSEQVASRLPWFIAAVIGLSFLLLTAVFRAPLVAFKAAVLNLLSIGAAYGAVVAVFQWGWGMELFGLEETVPIVSFVPMIMFAILFGLSMDYEVFLLSRVREEYLLGKGTTTSVVAGIATTARVITSAALIMICVFAGFVASTDPIVKMMGLGLAVAIFVDATVVRVVLVPSSMTLLGRANWWIPRWLDRIIPNLDIEGEGALPEPEYEGGRKPAPPAQEKLVGPRV